MKAIYEQFYQNKRKLFNHVFLKFVISGILSAALEMFLLIILVEHFHINYLIANSISFIVTNLFNYVLSRYWVFEKSNRTLHVEASLFLIVTLSGLMVNQLIMWLLVGKLGYNYKISKVLAIVAVVVLNFFGKKILVFSNTKKVHA